MNYRTLLLINACIAFIVGLGFLVLPDMIFGQFGVEAYAATRLLSQFFGTSMLGLGLFLWFATDVTDVRMQKQMGIALLVGVAAGLVPTVAETTSGNLSSNWWIAMMLYAVLALINASLMLLKPKSLRQ